MIVTPGGVELSPVERPPASEARQFEYDPATTEAGMAVVAALSEVLRTDPMEMNPVQATVDGDALGTLLGGPGAIEVTLPIGRHTVTVTSGVVSVRPAPSADRRRW